MNGRPWMMEEIQFLRDNYSKYSSKELARYFNRPPHSVRSMAQIQGIRKKGPLNAWSEDENNLLKELYLRFDNDKLADIFNRTRRAIERRAYLLGLNN